MSTTSSRLLSRRVMVNPDEGAAWVPGKTSKKRVADEAIGNAPVKSARKKRDSNVAASSRSAQVVDLTGETAAPPAKKTKAPKKEVPQQPGSERRARVFRKHPPKSYLERVDRARSQRMYVIGHTIGSSDNALEMKFNMVGSTGNIYETTISKVPWCNCPDSRKGNQCKHICYVLAIVLKAPEHLQYQLAFLSTELEEIYQGSSLSREQPKAEDKDGKRKPVEGDCPICFMEFEPTKEEIVWCRAACGNNIHKVCFDQWAATQNTQGVRCVYCRSAWETDTTHLNMGNLAKEGEINEEGYVNVARQLGLSGERDYSSYHQFWVNRQFGRSRYYYYDYD